MKTKQVNTRKTTEDAFLTASNALVRLAVSACAAGLVATCAFSETPVGPGSYKVETAEDVSYVESGFAVPANATQTIRPGVFFPEGGPVGVDEVVWRNVKLTDIASFTGKISEKNGNNYFWQEAGCYHVTTNAEEGYVQCQLQMKGAMSPTYGFVMQYRQEGQDVKARIVKGKYQTDKGEGDVDFDEYGANLDVTNTLYAADYKVRALADLGFVLRDGAETSVAPTEIVLASTDTSALDVSDEEVHRHVPCIASTNEILTVARNLRVADIVGMTGDISLKVEQGTLTTEVAWTNAQSYAMVVTNGGSTVKMYLLAEVDESTSRRRAGAVVQFDQVNADVQARIIWAGHQYKGPADNPNYADIDSPFGPGFGGQGIQTGVALDVTDVVGDDGVETVGHIALRNFKVRFRPSSRIVGDFGECIQREDGWVKLWNDVGLADIVLGPSRMAVNQHNLSNWNVASNHLRTAQDYTTQSYYQWRRGKTLYSIRFLMQDQFGDVYAKIASAHYNYDDNGSHPEYVPGYNPGTSDGAGNSFVAVTNVVNAVVAGAHDTLMIEHLTADVVAKKRHSVAVGADFNSGSSPVRLDSIKLALEPLANEEMTFCADVRGCGVVGVSGAGSVKLAADLPVNVGLDVDSGTAVIDSARRLEGNVSVKSGATLEFLFAPGRPDPLLEADSLSLEEGAVVAVDVERMIADSSEPMTYKLVSGCNYAEYALDGVSFVLTGRLKSVYKPEFFVDDDGDIALRATRIKGFVMIIR